ncbi:hypothetical protein R69927_04583 [Paraburkholderia domus]|jgi:hypothetical protein|uniref:hypothetical protein n=1 Tax=Paraburkholderia domus TaxID=2793075 RepID=UPI0019135BED|nr:hypothetical protein [Paraburkholderia domus]MBK5052056.1 hypothetical protein [Burkholderia sp. R-70006]MBK5064085.1 hypothetical protein [Burkholderia sp. R-70199]MBK5088898.1 hypothetical protein [Burkholderia sp. R-69927]MBK5124099.1 hypothetical protein [Burkholderia sp. R-69980]MBK5183021.1 hypothetical protein [Burkholderia sp. R-69749]MCI0149414.1 hypothetical protein [Paraburkholderia sediminicola]
MTIKRIACVLALLGGMVSMAAQAQPVVREANAPGAASKGTSAEARRRSQDTPFAFRGIALGITLDEFRAGSTVRATPLGSVPVCETDVQAGALGMRLKSHESLTVACRWAHRADDGWAVSQAVVDGAPAQEHVLRFARADGQSALRLYEISFVIDEITAEDLRDALADRYGTPRLVTHSASSSGAMPVYAWENAVSSITLCFLPGTRNGTLTYLLKGSDAWVKSVVRQWQASGAEAG